jgi:capsular polysaccharide transport system permease protein
MSTFVPIRPQYYDSVWKELKQIYFLLLIREVKTRFGRLKLGWIWIFLEPMLHLGILISVINLRSRATILEDVPNVVYMLNGLIPWFLFRDVVNRCTIAISANKSLFVFSSIRPFDTVYMRFMIELFLSCAIYFTATLGLWWIFDIIMLPTQLIEWFLSLFLLALLGIGLGGIVTVSTLYFPETQKIKDVAFTAFYFTSGIFFIPSRLPANIHYIFRWNPIFLGVDLCKTNAIEDYPPIPAEKIFFLLSALGVFIVGHYLVKRHMSRILSE